MNTNRKGDIGLIKTMSDLIVKGYSLFTPLSDITCVDLIAGNNDMNLKRIQVKYCSLKDGRICICTSTVVNGKKIAVDLSKVDIWCVYCPNNDNVYYIPIKDLVGKKTLNLRLMNQK